MSPEILSILILVVIFIIATTLPINMGVLAIRGCRSGRRLRCRLTADDIFAVFPGDLFIVLVGVTYLFGIAQSAEPSTAGAPCRPRRRRTSSSDTVDHVWGMQSSRR